jgi:hypothetical protein
VRAVFLSTFEIIMKPTPKEVIYRGIWRGLGKIYNIKVENGYTTILIKPGEDLRQRSVETKAKFARQLGGDNS